jgi:hypothetical protein
MPINRWDLQNWPANAQSARETDPDPIQFAEIVTILLPVGLEAWRPGRSRSRADRPPRLQLSCEAFARSGAPCPPFADRKRKRPACHPPPLTMRGQGRRHVTGLTGVHPRGPATRRRPSCAGRSALENRRGRRECRVKASPMARLQKDSRRQSPQVQPTSGIPCAMVLRFPSCSPWCAGLFGHHPPCDAKHHHDVDTSVGVSGPHDFAVRAGRSRLLSPSRPPPPRLTSRDDRDTPLFIEAGWARGSL